MKYHLKESAVNAIYSPEINILLREIKQFKDYIISDHFNNIMWSWMAPLSNIVTLQCLWTLNTFFHFNYLASGKKSSLIFCRWLTICYLCFASLELGKHDIDILIIVPNIHFCRGRHKSVTCYVIPLSHKGPVSLFFPSPVEGSLKLVSS